MKCMFLVFATLHRGLSCEQGQVQYATDSESISTDLHVKMSNFVAEINIYSLVQRAQLWRSHRGLRGCIIDDATETAGGPAAPPPLIRSCLCTVYKGHSSHKNL